MAETFIGKPWRQPYTAEQLVAAAANQVPIVGENGNWWRWDIETSAWVDTGVTVATGLVDGAVTTPKLAGGAVTWPKLSPEVQLDHRSLLDNGYFVGGGSQQRSGQFPINQRDQTEYTGAAGYCIDRWRRDAGLLVSLESDGLKLTRASEGNNALCQILDNPANLRGQTLTLSIVVKGTTGTSAGLGYNPGSGSTYGGYIPLTGDWQLISFVFSVPIDATSLSVIIRYATTNNFAAEEAVLAAAKLEIGPIQTLAHKDDDGNWVLNDPPPNYQQELAKCQNYYIPSHNGFYPLTVINGFGAICRIPGTMRAIPAVIDSGNRVYGTDGNWHTATPKSVELGPTFVIVKYDLGSSTWYTLGTTYMLQHAPALDANL